MSAVKDYLFTEPTFVDLNTTVKEAGKIMADKNIGAVVVAENGKPVGIFTERDFLHSSIESDSSSLTMGEWITGGVISINREASIERAIEKMLDQGIRRLLVVDDLGKAVGFITIRDLALALYDEVEELKALV